MNISLWFILILTSIIPWANGFISTPNIVILSIGLCGFSIYNYKYTLKNLIQSSIFRFIFVIILANFLYDLLAFINYRCEFDPNFSNFTSFRQVYSFLPSTVDPNTTLFKCLYNFNFEVSILTVWSVLINLNPKNYNTFCKIYRNSCAINITLLCIYGIVYHYFGNAKLLWIFQTQSKVPNEAFFGTFVYRNNAFAYILLIFPFATGFINNLKTNNRYIKYIFCMLLIVITFFSVLISGSRLAFFCILVQLCLLFVKFIPLSFWKVIVTISFLPVMIYLSGNKVLTIERLKSPGEWMYIANGNTVEFEALTIYFNGNLKPTNNSNNVFVISSSKKNDGFTDFIRLHKNSSGLYLDTRQELQVNSILINSGVSDNFKLSIYKRPDNTLEINIDDKVKHKVKIFKKLNIRYLQDSNKKIVGKQFIRKYNLIYSKRGHANSVLYQNTFVDNFKNIIFKSIHARHILYSNGFKMIQDNPFFGCGRGCFSYSYLNYREIDQKLEAWIHSDLLQHIIERGFTGFSLYLIIGLIFSYKIYKVTKFNDNINYTIIIGLLTLGVFALVDFPLDSLGVRYCASLLMLLLILSPKAYYRLNT